MPGPPGSHSRRPFRPLSAAAPAVSGDSCACPSSMTAASISDSSTFCCCHCCCSVPLVLRAPRPHPRRRLRIPETRGMYQLSSYSQNQLPSASTRARTHAHYKCFVLILATSRLLLLFQNIAGCGCKRRSKLVISTHAINLDIKVCCSSLARCPASGCHCRPSSRYMRPGRPGGIPLDGIILRYRINHAAVLGLSTIARPISQSICYTGLCKFA